MRKIRLDEWIRDGLRKNCATHLREIYKNDYDVVKDCGNSTRVLLKHYAALHVPPKHSIDFWDITPEKVKAYMKTPAWEKVLKEAAEKKFARDKADAEEAEKAKEAPKEAAKGPAKPSKQKASGTEKSGD